jgi:alkylation response protein AidB-like acyl-CoA dehydrogenase
MHDPSLPLSLGALESLIATHGAEGRRDAQLPQPIADALVELGLYRLWIPRRFGGLELPLPDGLRICEAVSRLDGAVGWAVMIGAGGGLFAAYLPADVAQRLFGPRNALVAGSGARNGTAERVDGGYRCSGRWRYASGAHQATIFTANCQVMEGGEPDVVDGAPLIRAMAFQPDQVQIVETWDTTGLRATGSHDMVVQDAFVPTSDTFSVFTDTPREAGALYRLPFGTMTELPISAVVLGIARHALALFETLSAAKPSTFGEGALAVHPRVALATRQARDAIDTAAATLQGLAEEAWRTATRESPIDQAVVGRCTTECARLVSSLVQSIGALAPLAGMNALHRSDAFSAAWQDLAAAAAHYSVSPLLIKD